MIPITLSAILTLFLYSHSLFESTLLFYWLYWTTRTRAVTVKSHGASDRDRHAGPSPPRRGDTLRVVGHGGIFSRGCLGPSPHYTTLRYSFADHILLLHILVVLLLRGICGVKLMTKGTMESPRGAQATRLGSRLHELHRARRRSATTPRPRSSTFSTLPQDHQRWSDAPRRLGPRRHWKSPRNTHRPVH